MVHCRVKMCGNYGLFQKGLTTLRDLQMAQKKSKLYGHPQSVPYMKSVRGISSLFWHFTLKSYYLKLEF